MKIELSEVNLRVLSGIKKAGKKGLRSFQVADLKGVAPRSADYHIARLKQAGKVTRDKKTLAWIAK